MKTLILKIVPKAASNFYSGLPSLSLVDFFQCTFTTFIDAGGYQKAGTSHVKRITRRIFTMSKCFIEASRNSIFYSFTKRQLIIVKTISTHSKSTVSIVRTFKQYSSRDTPSLSLASTVSS